MEGIRDLLGLWNGKVLLALEQELFVERNTLYVIFRMNILGFWIKRYKFADIVWQILSHEFNLI